MATERDWARVLTSPPVLLGALLLLIAGVFVMRSRPPEPPERVQVEMVGLETPRNTEEVELVLYDMGPSDAWLETPLYTEVETGRDASARYAAILAALQSARPAFWPTDLPLPDVIVAGEGGADVVVLDFGLERPVSVSVLAEMRLLLSIRATLERAGASRVRVLVNHRPSVTFLGHVLLEPTLE